MNRISTAIASKRAEIDGKVANGTLTADKVEKCRVAMDMDIEEHAKFQTLKTLAVAEGKITAEEGQTLYVLLGETISVFNGQDAATKVVLTSFFGELLNLRLGKKARRR